MIDSVLDLLAVFRLTHLAQVDQFPPVRRVRERVLRRWPEDSWQAYLAGCPWCLSVWIAGAVLPFRGTRVWRSLRFVLVASAVTGVIEEKL